MFKTVKKNEVNAGQKLPHFYNRKLWSVGLSSPHTRAMDEVKSFGLCALLSTSEVWSWVILRVLF